jgi:GMP synthase-like glutamine amidotransferase
MGASVNFLVLKHADCEGLGLWEECCHRAGIGIEVVDLHREAVIPPLHRFQAVISLGGPMNVYAEETYPFLKREDAFIRQVLAQGVPLLGVCLGGQVLAKAAGGAVNPNPVREIGWHPIELDQEGQRDPLFVGLPDRFTVFQRRGSAFSLPRGAVPLASSAAGQIQGFRLGFGTIAYALQFHLEVTPSMVEAWIGEYGGELARVGQAVESGRLLTESPARCHDLQSLAGRVFENFCRLVRLRFAGVDSLPAEPLQPEVRSGAKRKALTLEQAWEQYRQLIAKGKLRCGVTCPLDRIGHCTGGCW